MADPICDFCRSPEVRWVHYCARFNLPPAGLQGRPYLDDGEWAACDGCHELLVADDRDGLQVRALRGCLRTASAGKALDLSWMATLMEGFMDYRTGTWAPYVPDSEEIT